jgi:thiamine-phosphate pyrophosphorylase
MNPANAGAKGAGPHGEGEAAGDGGLPAGRNVRFIGDVGAKTPVDFRVYLVTDRRQAAGGDLLGAVARALAGGVQAVQLREKDLGARELLELARRLREMTSRHGARLLINDRVDIALACGADGVHLGVASLPPEDARRILGGDRLIGCSTHGMEQLAAAMARGADYVTFGPVFATPSKAHFGPPLGVEALRRACASADIPIFGIGGIGRENIGEVVAAGSYGIAAISALLAAGDPCAAASDMKRQVESVLSMHRKGSEGQS